MATAAMKKRTTKGAICSAETSPFRRGTLSSSLNDDALFMMLVQLPGYVRDPACFDTSCIKLPSRYNADLVYNFMQKIGKRENGILRDNRVYN